MTKKLTLGVCLFLSLCAPAFAILGLGDIVFDPTSYGELVKQLIQMQQEYEQLVQTYRMVENQYNHMLTMARQVPVTMTTRYRALSTPWLNSTATDLYGTSGGWTRGINTGISVEEGYSAAVLALEGYGSGLEAIPANQAGRVKSDYATVELTDGANIAGIETLGRLRANAPAVDATIRNLENDSLSSDPTMNTEIGVLNKINAAGVISLRNTQDTNKLLTTLAEHELIEAKRRRDAEAQAFNQHIQFMNQGKAALAAQSASASSAMLSWRMP